MKTAYVEAKEIEIGLNSSGCGHRILMRPEHYDVCFKEHRTWYCTVCGTARQYVGKTEAEQLRGELAAAKQREETEKSLRKAAEDALSKERAAAIAMKKRAQAGVCPCCTRTFTNVARHMKTKHPDYNKAKPKTGKKTSQYVAERLREIKEGRKP